MSLKLCSLRLKILLFSSLILGISPSFASDSVAKTTGSWNTQIDDLQIWLALWPTAQEGRLNGYVYIPKHDCLAAAHLFEFAGEWAFGFNTQSIRNRRGNCDQNLMVALPLFEGDGAISRNDNQNKLFVDFTQLSLGTPVTDLEESQTLIFRRTPPSPEFTQLLTSYKHLFRPDPPDSFIAQAKWGITPPARSHATPADFAMTNTGLKYKIVKSGQGEFPQSDDTVTVHYRGTLLDGREFDSSYSRGEPMSFPLTTVIKGWTEGLQLVRPGGKIRLIIPPELAYGDGSFGIITPGSTLVFEIELLSVK